MSASDYTKHTFNAMGTVCQLQFQTDSTAASNAFITQVTSWVSGFEAKFSRFRPDSLIARINAAAGLGAVDLDEESESLFALCDWFHWSTHGVFDPAALPLISLWDYHLPHTTLPDEAAVHSALALCGWKKIQRQKGSFALPEKGMGIDVGGIGKEYAVDRVFEMANQAGIQNVLVNFGHDLRVQGEPPETGPWRIGLEDPNDPGRCWGGVVIRNRAVTTSGNYARKVTINGETFGHILDPRSGRPVNNGCQSVSVIAPTCTEAGILSTTAFILGGAAGQPFLDSYYQVEGCVNEQKRQYLTRRFHEYLIRD
ncbi:MAG: FAD:protein FMN transferase [bacterium]